jgi:hydrogenase-4 membrane subunit HyfE
MIGASNAAAPARQPDGSASMSILLAVVAFLLVAFGIYVLVATPATGMSFGGMAVAFGLVIFALAAICRQLELLRPRSEAAERRAEARAAKRREPF